MTDKTVVLGYARTPFGKLGGGLATVPAVQLGGHAIAAAIERSGVAAADVEHVIMGHVLQAGAGQITSRQAAMHAGLDVTVTAETINKVCASALRATSLGDVLIRAGMHSVIVTGGMESMTQAPHTISMRAGVKMGNAELVDSMMGDGLTNPFRNVRMLTDGAEVAKEFGITRERQDAWAARSHQLAAKNQDWLAEEIAPLTIAHRKHEVTIAHDESVRPDTTVDTLSKLRELDVEGGGTTAGNAPGVNDGASALVLASESWAAERSLPIMARIVGHATVAGVSQYLASMPGDATRKLLDEHGLAASDIDRFEFNEAFASVTLRAIDTLDLDPDRVNVRGGAIAMGHPIGASGARVIGTLIRELQSIGGGRGVAAICSGGGQGDAILVEVASA